MSTKKLTNISVRMYREFLSKSGCQYIRTSDGHEVWAKKELTRPIVFQTHIDPIPEFIIRNALKSLGLSKNEFWQILNKK